MTSYSPRQASYPIIGSAKECLANLYRVHGDLKHVNVMPSRNLNPGQSSWFNDPECTW